MSERELEQDLAHDLAPAAQLPERCWKVIGTLGDNSCPRLETCVRCLNCPVFEEAAARMLDRPAPLAPTALALERAPESAATRTREAGSLVFRVGGEWLALPAAALRQVHEARAIHTLPHRRSAAVLGVVNVRGVLTLAVSLAALLRIDAGAPGTPSRAATPRLLVTEWAGATTAFPVDAVEGVANFGADALLPAPATLAQSAGRHVRGVMHWRGRSVGVVDVEVLFDALARSLR
ncbi:chemotaxis protein CheW [Paraburkholderia guartelaensis]|uniref:chemotaxis protein CheW n=1 Tax=Paraburkholderia guartelaensis TaxID=2546446 RepID=UPI002AB60087|nr:chemotaxis protein CheW [Paraburkholderia guartelaensis]